MAARLSVDVGATHTDLLLFDEQSGETRLLKRPSTPDDPAAAVLDGLDRLLADAGVSAGSIATLRIGGLVDDGPLVRGGTRVGLIVTAGFEHVLHLARGRTPGRLNGWAGMPAPQPPVDLADTVGVSERIDATGAVLQALDAAEARSAVQTLLSRGVDCIVISLLHAYANGAHEKQLRETAQAMAPDLPVLISSSTLPEFREYERTLVAVATAALRPAVSTTLERVSQHLDGGNAVRKLSVARRDGGTVSARGAAESPLHILHVSGTGALSGAAAVAAAAGQPQALCLDIGGHEARLGLIRDGHPTLGRRTAVAGQALPLPALEYEREPLGGSSVAQVYGGGLLGLGAENAGARPGPACYGQGGEQATLTDAHAVLGHLPSGGFGGSVRLDMEAAEEAVGRIARQLKLDLQPAAQAIVDLADEILLGALRRLLARERQKPDGFALIAAGGAGPLQAASLARLAGRYPIVVPHVPGALAPLGHLCAPVRTELLRSFGRPLKSLEPGQLAELCDVLERKARGWLTNEGVEESRQQVRFEADLRYGHDGPLVSLALEPASLANNGLGELETRFATAHRRRRGFQSGQPVELATLRAIGSGPADMPELRRYERGEPDPGVALVDQHQVWFDDGFVSTAHYDRARLRCGHRIEGPAIVTQTDATTLILPGQTATVDAGLNLIIQPADRSGSGSRSQ